MSAIVYETPTGFSSVTVTANGVWRGQHTHYRATYSNRCMLLRGKGTVFEF